MVTMQNSRTDNNSLSVNSFYRNRLFFLSKMKETEPIMIRFYSFIILLIILIKPIFILNVVWCS
jgi:hypothetical protein